MSLFNVFVAVEEVVTAAAVSDASAGRTIRLGFDSVIVLGMGAAGGRRQVSSFAVFSPDIMVGTA